MDEESLDSSLFVIKEEPPEELLDLIPADDDEAAPPEDSPKTEVKEEEAKEEFTQAVVKEEALRTNDQPSTKKHLKNERYSAVYDCPTCGVKFSNRLYLNCHQNEIHGIVFKCDNDKCSYQGKNIQQLLRHKKIHNRSIGCETCQMKFSSDQPLKFHQMQHRHGIYATAPEETFDCDKCSKSFSNPMYLRRHRRQVHDENEVKCEVCGKRFKNRLVLVQHLQSHKHVECSICCLTIQKRSLASHLRAHSGIRFAEIRFDENYFQCDLCGYSTRSKRLLREHIGRRHLLVKLENDAVKKLKDRFRMSRTGYRIKCDQCSEGKRNKYFASLSTLNIHMRMVHAEKFTRSSQRHANHVIIPREALIIRAHPEEVVNPQWTPANVKEEPPEEFLLELPPTTNDQTQTAKQQDAKIETGERKFCCTLNCSKCGQEFTSIEDLLKHLDSLLTYKCVICDANFSCKRLSDRHRNEVHGDLLGGDKFSDEAGNLQATGSDFEQPNQMDSTMEESNFDFSSVDVKEEPPEEFILVLPTPGDNSSAAEEVKEAEDDKGDNKKLPTLKKKPGAATP